MTPGTINNVRYGVSGSTKTFIEKVAEGLFMTLLPPGLMVFGAIAMVLMIVGGNVANAIWPAHYMGTLFFVICGLVSLIIAVTANYQLFKD